MILTAPIFIKPGILARCTLTGFSSTYFLYTIHIEPHNARVRVRITDRSIRHARPGTPCARARAYH